MCLDLSASLFTAMAPAFRYHLGVWGEPTSTLDWCEENYVVTKYVAEFWNTVSNWVMIVPPLLGVILTWQNKIELRYTIAFFSFFVVGVGSLCFHATLLYEMQLLDELPMIYCTCVFMFCIAECSRPCGKPNFTLILFLITCSSMVTLVYLTITNPLVFQWAYGILVSALTVMAVYKCWLHRGCRRLLLSSLISYGAGFIVWNIDNNFCPSVRQVRESLVVLLHPFVQLHAVWHILAGIGTYCHILYSIDLRMRCLGKRPVIRPYWGWLPFFHVSSAQAPTKRTVSWTQLATSSSSSARDHDPFYQCFYRLYTRMSVRT